MKAKSIYLSLTGSFILLATIVLVRLVYIEAQKPRHLSTSSSDPNPYLIVLIPITLWSVGAIIWEFTKRDMPRFLGFLCVGIGLLVQVCFVGCSLIALL
ncbi:hypothetical protein P4631_19315 [Halalkalibacterium halodurans]|uniref:hypothetical protein n=1 Tax=Halalkalibacterium halodurans TaxID=86665 RepID=UPI002E22CD90|nr:hypothetical protein [Halalkalibacterium halodurans]